MKKICAGREKPPKKLSGRTEDEVSPPEALTGDAVTTGGATDIAPGTGINREDDLIAEAMLEAMATETGGVTDTTGTATSAAEEDISLMPAEKNRDNSPSVKDRLKNNRQFWAHTLRAPQFIQSIIDHGSPTENNMSLSMVLTQP